MIAAIAIRSGESRISAARLPPISISLLTTWDARARSLSLATSGYSVKSGGLAGPCFSQSSGKTWNEILILLTCSRPSVSSSAPFALAISALAIGVLPSGPSSVKITPIILRCLYQPLISVSLVAFTKVFSAFSKTSSLFAPSHSSSISTKYRPERSVRLRSKRSLLAN